MDVAAIDAFCQQYFEEGAAAPTPDFTAVPLLLGVNPGTSSNIVRLQGQGRLRVAGTACCGG